MHAHTENIRKRDSERARVSDRQREREREKGGKLSIYIHTLTHSLSIYMGRKRESEVYTHSLSLFLSHTPGHSLSLSLTHTPGQERRETVRESERTFQRLPQHFVPVSPPL